MKTIITSLLFLCLLPFGVFGTTITVTSNGDSGPGSLRQAILDASNGDEIVFNLSGNETITLQSELSITESIEQLRAEIENLKNLFTPIRN